SMVIRIDIMVVLPYFWCPNYESYRQEFARLVPNSCLSQLPDPAQFVTVTLRLNLNLIDHVETHLRIVRTAALLTACCGASRRKRFRQEHTYVSEASVQSIPGMD